MGTFTIGKLADAAGVNVETVRYYERRGLLEQPDRAPGGGYRQYGEDDLWRLQFVGRGKALGFTLTEIADLLAAGDTAAVLAAAQAKIAAVEARQAELAGLRNRLERLVDLCERGAGEDCASLRIVS